jgi:hypothetical protein
MVFRINAVLLLAAAMFALILAGNAIGDSNPDIASREVITSVPRIMTYQGILKDSAGNPVADSVYSVTFRLFDQESGGSSLWDQTLPCTTSTGYFNTTFSNVNLPFDVDYWLEMEVGGEILDPRREMSMVGYAAVSDTADYAASGGGWVDDGLNVRLSESNDKVGIGIESPSYKLDVHGTVGIDVDSNFTDIPLTLSVPSNHSGLISRIAKGGSVINVVDGNGNVGIGTFNPTAKLDVDGDIFGNFDLDINGAGSFAGGITTYDINTSGFQMSTGSSSGYVLTSDGSGNGTWQAPSGGTDFDWTISGSDMYSTVSGKVGIGTTSPDYKLDVLGMMGIDVGSNYGDTPLTLDVPFNQDALIFRIAKGGSVIDVVDGNGNVGIGVFSPTAKLDVNGDIYGRYDLDLDGTGSFAGGITTYDINTSGFQMTTGASSGYVLTSDGSGNGTWQALPPAMNANSESIERIDTRIEELVRVVESQSEKIAQLENRIAELEGEKE